MSMYECSLDDDDGPQDYFSSATLRIGDVKQDKNRTVVEKNAASAQSDPNNSENVGSRLISEPNSSNVAPGQSKGDAVIPWSGEDANTFFASREGLVKRAIQDCTRELVDEKLDKLLGSWLLTEISLWDNEKERLVILTTEELMLVKYDFIALKILDHRKVQLSMIDNVINGDLVYPNGSIVPRLSGLANGMTHVVKGCLFNSLQKKQCSPAWDPKEFEPRPRNMIGVRAMWNKGQPLDMLTKWNAFSNNIPLCTLTSHPLLWCKESNLEEKKLYCIDHFYADFVRAVELANAATSSCNIQHKPIVLENYLGLTSLIYNKYSLGFFKIRGKFSF